MPKCSTFSIHHLSLRCCFRLSPQALESDTRVLAYEAGHKNKVGSIGLCPPASPCPCRFISSHHQPLRRTFDAFVGTAALLNCVLLFQRQIRINAISAGPLGSRAAKAIGFIDDMINYSYANAPIQKELSALEVRAKRQQSHRHNSLVLSRTLSLHQIQ